MIVRQRRRPELAWSQSNSNNKWATILRREVGRHPTDLFSPITPGIGLETLAHIKKQGFKKAFLGNRASRVSCTNKVAVPKERPPLCWETP